MNEFETATQKRQRMITVKPIDSQTFKEHQGEFACSNFLQTTEMYEVQSLATHLDGCEQVGFFDGEALVGQANVIYRTRFHKFEEAMVLHGPLLDYENQQLVLDAFMALDYYMKLKKVASVQVFPYVLNSLYNQDLESIFEDKHAELKQALQKHGYSHEFDTSQSTVINTMFVKPIVGFENIEEIHDGLNLKLRQHLKKAEQSHIKTKCLGLDELGEFYDILESTGDRKGFVSQDIEYFKQIKEHFGDKAQFLLAYLDVPAYAQYLSENIERLKDEIAELEAGPQKKRTKGQIANATTALNSFVKRRENLEEMNPQGDTIPMSSYLFMCTDSEVVSFAGGNYEQYMNFGGANVLHWEMIKYCFENGIPAFNFYGTIETDQAKEGRGNFNFKKNFGGELRVLIGEFSKDFDGAYKLIKKIKK